MSETDKKEENTDNVKVPKEELKKVEEEVQKGLEEKRARDKADIENLLKEAEKKGGEAALQKYLETQKLQELEETNKKIQEELKTKDSEYKAQLEALKKQIEEASIKSKGVAKNESPFDKRDEPEKIPITVDDLKEIDERSRDEFFKAHLGRKI